MICGYEHNIAIAKNIYKKIKFTIEQYFDKKNNIVHDTKIKNYPKLNFPNNILISKKEIFPFVYENVKWNPYTQKLECESYIYKLEKMKLNKFAKIKNYPKLNFLNNILISKKEIFPFVYENVKWNPYTQKLECESYIYKLEKMKSNKIL